MHKNTVIQYVSDRLVTCYVFTYATYMHVSHVPMRIHRHARTHARTRMHAQTHAHTMVINRQRQSATNIMKYINLPVSYQPRNADLSTYSIVCRYMCMDIIQ